MLTWLTGKSKSNMSEPTALQNQKSKQIEQLKIFNQNVSEIQRDVEYRVNTTVNGTTISLYISLPPQFPQEKPLVKVSPRVNHPWVNDQNVIHASPGLNNFMIHSDLGKVIREVIEEFHRNPPTLLATQYNFGNFPHVTSPSVTTSTGAAASQIPLTNPPNHLQTSASYQEPSIPNYISSLPVSLPHVYTVPSTTGAQPSMVPGYRDSGDGLANYGMPVLGQNQIPSTTVGSYRMPDIPINLAMLSEMSKPELVDLLDNEDKVLEIIKSLPEIHQLSQDRERFTQLNEEIARQNLALKPVLEEKKKVLLEKYDIFNEIKQRYDDNSHKQDVMRQRFDPRQIQDNLKVAAQQAEEVSEGVADRFLEGKITIDQFKKDYMDKRKLGHLRKAKEERMARCILNPGRGGF